MQIVCLALTAFWILLIVRVVFSWIPRPPEPLVALEGVTRTATDWAVEPLRRMIPPVQLGGIALDVSILVVFFGVQILMSVIC